MASSAFIMDLAHDNNDRVSNPKNIWIEVFKIKAHEVDFRRCATLETLFRYFQEAAWNHAQTLGVGYSHLHEQGKIWVLSRLQGIVERYPLWGESIQVITWPRTVESLFALRDFQMLASDGTRLVSGNSAYLVLNASTRRPQRVDKLLTSVPHVADRCALPNGPDKLPEFGEGNCQSTLRVGYSDIDMHHHVNNSRYISWMLDTYPMEYHQMHRVSRMEVNYLGEAHCGDTLSIKTGTNQDNIFDHMVLNPAQNTAICRARIHWSSHNENQQ